MGLKLAGVAVETFPVSKQAATSEFRRVHDELLRQMPNGASHDPELCPVCAPTHQAEVAAVKTYTEDELRAEVDRATAEATGSLRARLAELEGKEAQASVEAAVAAATEEANTKVAELEARLDAAVLAANEATERHDATLSYLAEMAAAEEAKAAAAARRGGRMAQVAEVAKFTDAQLEERADRWAAMDDDEFASVLADYRAIAAAAAEVTTAHGDTNSTPPAQTAMVAAAPAPTGSRTSAIQGALALRRTAVAPNTV